MDVAPLLAPYGNDGLDFVALHEPFPLTGTDPFPVERAILRSLGR